MLIPITEVATRCGVSVRTIQRERALRVGPPYIKLGRKTFYRAEAIETWLMGKEQAQPRAGRAI